MIRHVAGITEVVDDIEAAVRFYRDVLGLPVEHETGGLHATVKIDGVLHFGIWARRGAAEATFGDPNATDRIPLGFSVEFEVDSVQESVDEMTAKGWAIAQPTKQEPWGQTTARFFQPSGALSGFSETPWMRHIAQPLKGEAEG